MKSEPSVTWDNLYIELHTFFQESQLIWQLSQQFLHLEINLTRWFFYFFFSILFYFILFWLIRGIFGRVKFFKFFTNFREWEISKVSPRQIFSNERFEEILRDKFLWISSFQKFFKVVIDTMRFKKTLNSKCETSYIYEWRTLIHRL